MTVFDPALLLSAQRALLGAIGTDVRKVGVRREGETIVVTTVSAQPLSDTAADALSAAAGEIIADFPGCKIDERLVVSGAVPLSGISVGHPVFQRLEVA